MGEATVVDLGGGLYLFALISDAESRGLQVFAGMETVMNLPPPDVLSMQQEL